MCVMADVREPAQEGSEDARSLEGSVKKQLGG